MASIQNSPHPLVFPLSKGNPAGNPASGDDRVNLRTCTRSLAGMQKEAIVSDGPNGKQWRMVCDEGPYLNGTDLAPFPLAFFTAGMAASYMSEILALLAQENIKHRNITLIQDNLYSMEGSALQGTMTGSALPVELKLQADCDADDDRLKQVLMAAIAASPAGALLRQVLTSEFSITHNLQPLIPGRVNKLAGPIPPAPCDFDAATPAPDDDFPHDIIVKNQSAETVFGVDGGAGSSLTAEQKRTLHIRGICTIREDGLKQIQVQLFKPIGSLFRFLSDDSQLFGGRGRAPSGLAYLSAGLAFCYMTQLGRYSHIVKKPLDLYRIIQDTSFSLPGASGKTGKAADMDVVKTHVYVDTGEEADYVRTLIDMGEQTCFLHAACREAVKARIAP